MHIPDSVRITCTRRSSYLLELPACPSTFSSWRRRLLDKRKSSRRRGRSCSTKALFRLTTPKSTSNSNDSGRRQARKVVPWKSSRKHLLWTCTPLTNQRNSWWQSRARPRPRSIWIARTPSSSIRSLSLMAYRQIGHRRRCRVNYKLPRSTPLRIRTKSGSKRPIPIWSLMTTTNLQSRSFLMTAHSLLRRARTSQQLVMCPNTVLKKLGAWRWCPGSTATSSLRTLCSIVEARLRRTSWVRSHRLDLRRISILETNKWVSNQPYSSVVHPERSNRSAPSLHQAAAATLALLKISGRVSSPWASNPQWSWLRATSIIQRRFITRVLAFKSTRLAGPRVSLLEIHQPPTLTTVIQVYPPRMRTRSKFSDGGNLTTVRGGHRSSEM